MGNFDSLEDWKIPTKPVETSVKRARGAPKRIGGEFLRGPIPMSWLSVASRTDDVAALQVALAIWWESGRRNSREIRLTGEVIARFQDGDDRKRKYRGLKVLEDAGLISVVRSPGKNPIVKLLVGDA